MKKILYILLFICLPLTLSAQLVVMEEKVALKTSTGDIFATLRVPDNKKAIPVALLIAGSGPTDRDGNNSQMRNNSLKMLAEGLYYNNIASLAFDKRGIGESKAAGKNEADLRFEDYINDVKQWIDLLSKDKRFSEIVVIGHSEGSLIGMVAAQSNPKVTKYISLAGSGKGAAVILKEQMEDRLKTQPAVKEITFSYIDKLEKGETIENVPPSLSALFRSSVQPYMISWFKYNPQTEIRKLTIPVMVMQGTTDIQVSIEHAELLAKANPKAEKVIIEKMNHILKNSESMDITTQLSTTYNNPVAPLNRELIKYITEFIK